MICVNPQRLKLSNLASTQQTRNKFGYHDIQLVKLKGCELNYGQKYQLPLAKAATELSVTSKLTYTNTSGGAGGIRPITSKAHFNRISWHLVIHPTCMRISTIDHTCWMISICKARGSFEGHSVFLCLTGKTVAALLTCQLLLLLLISSFQCVFSPCLS